MESKFVKILGISPLGTLCTSSIRSGFSLGKSLITGGTITVYYYPEEKGKYQWVIFFVKNLDVFIGHIADVLANEGFTSPEHILTTEQKNYIEEAIIYLEDYNEKNKAGLFA